MARRTNRCHSVFSDFSIVTPIHDTNTLFLLSLPIPAVVPGPHPRRLPLDHQEENTTTTTTTTTATVEYHNPSTSHRWIEHSVLLTEHRILPRSRFGHTGTPSDNDINPCANLKYDLARRGTFVSFRWDAGTKLRVRWHSDGGEEEVCNAEVADDEDVPWADLSMVDDNGRGAGDGATGTTAASKADVLVFWKDEEAYSLVSLDRCTAVVTNGVPTDAGAVSVPDQRPYATAVGETNGGEEEEEDDDIPQLALLQSLASCGKTFRRAESLVVTADGSKDPPPNAAAATTTVERHADDKDDIAIEGLWADENEWYPAEGVDYRWPRLKKDGEKRAVEFVKVISKHRDGGGGEGWYCVVQWEDDGTVLLLPERSVREKKKVGM